MYLGVGVIWKRKVNRRVIWKRKVNGRGKYIVEGYKLDR